MIKGRDVWWEDEIKRSKRLAWRAACRRNGCWKILFILYTWGQPVNQKGGACIGRLYGLDSVHFCNVFHYQPGDIHFCTADIGWITGHSYIVYGPLWRRVRPRWCLKAFPHGPTQGVSGYHRTSLKWTILYTAPTAIRSLMGFGLGPLHGKRLDPLKVLGTVGEPINEEAWHWYDETHRQKRNARSLIPGGRQKPVCAHF